MVELENTVGFDMKYESDNGAAVAVLTASVYIGMILICFALNWRYRGNLI